ncbi:GrpB family protein [Microbacterium sp. CPCC 204701]|uniref:GrpB family protein n=1 Tax=Microbacterium sp. CPCC 204701 TaxID=2493084 RepID=UPI000FDBC483|nr:GrpB family protein [Microbacterium sp. CPCC 204701]
MVDLQPHTPRWAEEFRLEASRVLAATAGHLDAVEHIGSTSVPGLVAKPIIDLAGRAASAVDPFSLDALLDRIGYAPHTMGPKNHAVYVRHQDGRRSHILHVFTAEDWETCNQRLFRDKLRHDPEARRRYAALKISLASALDGRAYTLAKRALIQELLNEERAARGLLPTTAWDK